MKKLGKLLSVLLALALLVGSLSLSIFAEDESVNPDNELFDSKGQLALTDAEKGIYAFKYSNYGYADFENNKFSADSGKTNAYGTQPSQGVSAGAMLAGVQHLDGLLGVQRNGRDQVDGVHLGVGQDLLKAAVQLIDAEVVGCVFQHLGVGVVQTDAADVRMLLVNAGEGSAKAQADQSDVDFFHNVVPVQSYFFCVQERECCYCEQ